MNVELNVFLMFILAAVAAAISVYTSDKKSPVLKNDKERFLLGAFRSESFYRAWVINLGFAGIAFALSARPSASSGMLYTVFVHPYTLLFCNIIAAAIGGVKLSEDDEKPTSKCRIFHVAFYVLFSIVMFLASSWAFTNYKMYFGTSEGVRKITGELRAVTDSGTKTNGKTMAESTMKQK